MGKRPLNVTIVLTTCDEIKSKLVNFLEREKEDLVFSYKTLVLNDNIKVDNELEDSILIEVYDFALKSLGVGKEDSEIFKLKNNVDIEINNKNEIIIKTPKINDNGKSHFQSLCFDKELV